MADMRLNILISATNSASSVLSGIAESIGKANVGFIAAGLAIVGVGVALGASVKAAADFQTGLTVLSTGAGELKSNLQMVGDGIKQISIDTGTSTQQLLSGMFMIESAGYRGADALNVLKVAAQGARLENTDLGAVAFSLTGLLHDYGMKSTEAAQAMNALIVTESSGKMHMQDLTTSLGNVLPLASTLKVAYPQIGAAIAVMTNANMTARRATQNLNFELRALSAPSATAVKAMQSVGLSAQQVKDTLTKQGLTGVIQLITDAVGRTFPKGSVAWVEAMKAINGGATGLNVALMLSGSHMKEFQTDVTNITAAMNNGKAGVMNWSQVQGTFNFQMSQLGAAMQVLLINIGTGLLPVLGQIVTAITPVVVAFAKWIATGQAGNAIMGAFRAVMAFLAPILTVIGNFLKATFLPVWQQLVAVWNAQILPALKQLWAALQPLVPIIGVVLVIALGLLIGILAGLAKGLAGLLSGVITIFAGIVKVITGAVQIISGIVTFIVDLFTGNFSKLGSDLGVIWQGIQNIFSGALQIIAGFFQAIWGTISGIVSGMVQGIIGFFTTLWSDLVGHSIIPDMINGIIMWFMMLPTAIGNAFSGLGTLVHSIWDGITLGVKGGINAIISVINGFIGFIDSIQIHIPSIGVGPFQTPAFNWNGLGIPQIPYLATGGYVQASGLAMIHQGETVTPARVASLGGGSGEIHHHYNITINAMHREHTPQELATKVLDEVSRKLRSSGGLVTTTSGGRAF